MSCPEKSSVKLPGLYQYALPMALPGLLDSVRQVEQLSGPDRKVAELCLYLINKTLGECDKYSLLILYSSRA